MLYHIHLFKQPRCLNFKHIFYKSFKKTYIKKFRIEGKHFEIRFLSTCVLIKPDIIEAKHS